MSSHLFEKNGRSQRCSLRNVICREVFFHYLFSLVPLEQRGMHRSARSRNRGTGKKEVVQPSPNRTNNDSSQSLCLVRNCYCGRIAPPIGSRRAIINELKLERFAMRGINQMPAAVSIYLEKLSLHMDKYE